MEIIEIYITALCFGFFAAIIMLDFETLEDHVSNKKNQSIYRGKILLDLWGTTFLPN